MDILLGRNDKCDNKCPRTNKMHGKDSNDRVNGNLNPMWQHCTTAFVCENAATREFHQESDCSYTVIAVPYFDEDMSEKLDEYKFQFRWSLNEGGSRTGIDIALTQGTVLAYSGFLVLHRQVLRRKKKSGFFFNYSTYHNKRLFCNVKKKLAEDSQGSG